MSSGTSTPWRLLSPFAVLLWVAMVVGFADAAHADTSTGPARAAAAQATADQGHQATEQRTSDQHTTGQDAAAPQSGSASGTDRGGTSGDTGSPQPISNADANSGGANGQCPGGPYCSTRDGSASGNGDGGGKATGEPCAGCVGKADNKNPAGQMPNASDANAGYECDTNQGIAKTNPAHTGCVTTQPECVPTPEVPCVSPPECVPTPEVPCETPPECVPTPEVPCVSPPECVPTPEVPCETPPLVSPPTPPQAGPPRSPQRLPSTGAPAALPVLAGLGLAGVVIGSGLLLGRRRASGLMP